ncbi:MAG: hypothetical protein M1477_06520 [Candidatus Thermoplasmatota archaeon]|nr:hypothetical protein [Candidatus Thermoplasmatota archaeon]
MKSSVLVLQLFYSDFHSKRLRWNLHGLEFSSQPEGTVHHAKLSYFTGVCLHETIHDMISLTPLYWWRMQYVYGNNAFSPSLAKRSFSLAYVKKTHAHPKIISGGAS